MPDDETNNDEPFTVLNLPVGVDITYTPQRLPYKLPPPDPRLDATHDDGRSVTAFFMIGIATIATIVMIVKIIAMMR